MQHKTASALSITFILVLFVLGPAAFVYIVDPFQIYHKPIFAEAKFGVDQNHQHAGWINRLLADPTQNYQAIVIGSSTMANYTQTLINNHLAWGNTLNLSVNGSTPLMQHSIARYALEKKPDIRHILWDVHLYYAYAHDPKHPEKIELQFPGYLYNNSMLDDKRYLYNQSNVETGLKFLTGDFSTFDAGIENNGPFYKDLLANNRFNIYGSPENRRDNLLPQTTNINWQQPDKESYLKYSYPSIDAYLLDLLLPLCNKDVDINITFSPVARYYYISIPDPDYIYSQILMRRYMVDHTRSCSNIRVFAFDNLDWIVTDLHNYADNFHYDIKINNYIMASIAKNENRLTVDNIDSYEKQFIVNLNNYKSSFVASLDQP